MPAASIIQSSFWKTENCHERGTFDDDCCQFKFENSFQVGFTTPIIGYRSRSCVFLTKHNFSRISVPF